MTRDSRFPLLLLLLAVAGCAHFEGDFAGAETSPPATSPTPTSTPASASCEPGDTSLIACYAFNGNGADGSGNGLDISLVNVAYATGVEGLAGKFAASSGATVASGTSFDVPALSYEAWFQIGTFPTAYEWRVFDKDGSFAMVLTTSGGAACLVPGAKVTMGPIAVGTWTHLACTFGGTTLSGYLDGELGGFAAVGGGLPVSANDLHLGEDRLSGDQFEGLLDRAFLWNRVRTQDELCVEAGTC